VLHLVPSGQATRYEFAREIVKAGGSRSSVEAVPTASFPSAARRPKFSVLDNGRAAAVLGIRLAGWKDLLRSL
jgi:dTDP-4-dehydrorhamnose reductase